MLQEALARVGVLAEALRATEDGLAAATYLTNQATACLTAWRTEEITAAVAVTVLDRLGATSRAVRSP